MSTDLLYHVQMTEEQWSGWLLALREGNYRQGRAQLKVGASQYYPEQPPSYCCLGVFCHLNDVDLDTADEDGVSWGMRGGVTTAPPLLRKAMSPSLRAKLADMNDSGNYSFQNIAAWLEEARARGLLEVVQPTSTST